MKGNERPPGVLRPERHDADVCRDTLELPGDVGSQVAVREERLRVSGGDDLQLAALVQLADSEERTTGAGPPERECALELFSL
jgi:hypothetical protein